MNLEILKIHLFVCVICSIMSDSATPWKVAFHAVLSTEFSGQEYWSGLPFASPGDLPDPGIKPMSLASPALAGGLFTTSQPGKTSDQITFLLTRKKIEMWANA